MTMELEIEYLPVGALKPYRKNARKHSERDIRAIMASIRDCEFNDPIGIWGPDNLIVEGHGRLIAAQRLGMETVPCIRLDHLSDEQRRAYALAHNRTAELSAWDSALTKEETAALWGKFDMEAFGFDAVLKPKEEKKDNGAEWFDRKEKDGDSTEGESPEYAEFVDKFKGKKTTDDCYTPENIYEAVAEWVGKEFGIRRGDMVRPFYPGGDYQRAEYPEGSVVVDNPPFSILAEIIRFYCESGVKFFLFAPALTLFQAAGDKAGVCYMPCYATITYENGAGVNTSFVTNLDEEYRIRSVPDLWQAIHAEEEKNRKGRAKELPKYAYPDEVVTAVMCGRWAKYGIEFRVRPEECFMIREFDEMKGSGKAIFGNGYLLNEKKAAERAAAERAAAHRWELSEREKAIVRGLNR